VWPSPRDPADREVGGVFHCCKAEDFWHVQFEVYRALLARFRERQIEIPYPHREVRLISATS
jgi:small-conductance mechanosensitive channel